MIHGGCDGNQNNSHSIDIKHAIFIFPEDFIRLESMRNRWEFAGTSSELAQKIVSNLVTFLSRFPKTILKAKSLFDCIDFYI